MTFRGSLDSREAHRLCTERIVHGSFPNAFAFIGQRVYLGVRAHGIIGTALVAVNDGWRVIATIVIALDAFLLILSAESCYSRLEATPNDYIARSHYHGTLLGTLAHSNVQGRIIVHLSAISAGETFEIPHHGTRIFWGTTSTHHSTLGLE